MHIGVPPLTNVVGDDTAAASSSLSVTASAPRVAYDTMFSFAFPGQSDPIVSDPTGLWAKLGDPSAASTTSSDIIITSPLGPSAPSNVPVSPLPIATVTSATISSSSSSSPPSAIASSTPTLNSRTWEKQIAVVVNKDMLYKLESYDLEVLVDEKMLILPSRDEEMILINQANAIAAKTRPRKATNNTSTSSSSAAANSSVVATNSGSTNRPTSRQGVSSSSGSSSRVANKKDKNIEVVEEKTSDAHPALDGVSWTRQTNAVTLGLSPLIIGTILTLTSLPHTNNINMI
jgi:hypothetical protein